MPELISEEDFRAALQAGAAPADSSLRKGFVSEVRTAADDERALDFTISTAEVDRYGDTVAVDGWKLESYRKNPVVLWAHDSSIMPVGKASNIRVEDGKLKARATFMPKELSGFANAVLGALKAGFLSAVSVGFLPLKYAFVDDPTRRYGIDFAEQELLEFSVVPVPANPSALIEGRSFDQGPLLEWAEQTIERHAGADRIGAFVQRLAGQQGNAIVSRDRIERIERAATAQRLATRRAREIELIRIRGA